MSDWLSAVMIHYEVDAHVLQREVPFELDTFDNRAFVSLVAFQMAGLRTTRYPNLGRRLFSPIGTHAFLNVRTYVRGQGQRGQCEPGIYFLAEYLPNRLSVLLGPAAYGLPYRFGNLVYTHDIKSQAIAGRVTAGRPEKRLTYRACIAPDTHSSTASAGSLTEFLMERYTAFTHWQGIARRFRIWHEPWSQEQVEAEILDDSLLTTTGNWFADAQVIGANHSPGVRNVWMGRPRLIRCGANQLNETHSQRQEHH